VPLFLSSPGFTILWPVNMASMSHALNQRCPLHIYRESSASTLDPIFFFSMAYRIASALALS
jgi:hypothetical protein